MRRAKSLPTSPLPYTILAIATVSSGESWRHCDVFQLVRYTDGSGYGVRAVEGAPNWKPGTTIAGIGAHGPFRAFDVALHVYALLVALARVRETQPRELDPVNGFPRPRPTFRVLDFTNPVDVESNRRAGVVVELGNGPEHAAYHAYTVECEKRIAERR